MIHYLVWEELVMVHVFGHEGPQEVEAGRLFVFVFDPATAFQSTFDVTVAAADDKDFSIGLDSVFLFPFFHVCYVELDSLDHSLIPLQEVIKSIRIDRCSWFSRCRTCHSNLILLAILIVSFSFQSTILLLSE